MFMEKTMYKALDIIDENEKVIANILHDVKSPLYSIKIGLQNHLQDELLKDVFETTVNTIEYIEKFLVDYNFRQGKFENKTKLCDVKKIIDKKIENYKYIFINKRINIDMYLEDEDYTVNSIEMFLSSIIGNIISNIAFHAAENKSASIDIYRKNSNIIVTFKNYYNKNTQNSALGLDFCKKLAQLTKIELKIKKTKEEVSVNLKIPALKTFSKRQIIGI